LRLWLDGCRHARKDARAVAATSHLVGSFRWLAPAAQRRLPCPRAARTIGPPRWRATLPAAVDRRAARAGVAPARRPRRSAPSPKGVEPRARALRSPWRRPRPSAGSSRWLRPLCPDTARRRARARRAVLRAARRLRLSERPVLLGARVVPCDRHRAGALARALAESRRRLAAARALPRTSAAHLRCASALALVPARVH